jgi:MFS family permease
VATDRLARLHHGYTDKDDMECSEQIIKPKECLDASSEAQNYAATAFMISNTLTFLASPLMGSLSDEYGRRGTYTLCATFVTAQNVCVFFEFDCLLSRTCIPTKNLCSPVDG